MSKPRELWWGYVKNVLRAYPDYRRGGAKLRSAVERAMKETRNLPNGEWRCAIIEKVYFRESHTLVGAARCCHVSYGAAKEWHGEFVRLVAKHLGLP